RRVARPPAAGLGGGAAQPQYVAHVEQAAFARGEESACAQRAMRVGDAARRAMRDLDPFAGAGEQGGMVADDVAAAHRREPDGVRVAFAGEALASEDGDLLQVAT